MRGVDITTEQPADIRGLGTEISRFGRLIAAWQQLARADAGSADRVLLSRLVTEGDRRATDLATEAFLDLSTVSRQISSLVERGLVVRRPDPEDRRVTLLSATDAGRETYEHYRRQRDAKMAALLQEWTAEDRTELLRLLGRLNDDLTRQYARHAPAGDQGKAEQEQGETQR